MNDTFLLLLFPALLLCVLKLTLVERLWMVLPSALCIAAIPVLLHTYASRTSFIGLERLISTRAVLDALAVLIVSWFSGKWTSAVLV